MLSAILWDMDGTVLNSEPVHEKAFNAAVAELGYQVPPELHENLRGASGVDIHRALSEFTGSQMTLQQWVSLKWKHYQRFAHEITPMHGMPAILTHLQNKGIPMALVSNSTREEVDLNLQSTAFSHYFTTTISRNDVAQGKPAPDAYLAAAKALSVAPEACLVIEDSITGSRAGLAANMTTVLHPELEYLLAQAPQGVILIPPNESLIPFLIQSELY